MMGCSSAADLERMVRGNMLNNRQITSVDIKILTQSLAPTSDPSAEQQ